MIALTLSGTVGLGSILTLILLSGSVVALYAKWQQGDPSEWRENYLGEVARREEVERDAFEQRELKHSALAEVAALKARTDLAPLMQAISEMASASRHSEERLTARLDAFEANQHQFATILSSLASRVAEMRQE